MDSIFRVESGMSQDKNGGTSQYKPINCFPMGTRNFCPGCEEDGTNRENPENKVFLIMIFLWKRVSWYMPTNPGCEFRVCMERRKICHTT